MESVIKGILLIERDIEEKEFMGRKDIEYLIVVGDHKIGNEAFCGCTNLQTVIIDTKDVGMSCFKDCKNLTTVVFWQQPYVLVRSYAFYGCRRLEFVYTQNDDALDISCLGNCYLKDAPKLILEEKENENPVL